MSTELEELNKNLCETIEQMRYTIVSLSAGESVKFDLHCSKCGKETKILHPVAIEGEYEFELKQRIAELEERINKANTILIDYMGQWAGVCDIYLPENMLPIYNTVSILRGEE